MFVISPSFFLLSTIKKNWCSTTMFIIEIFRVCNVLMPCPRFFFSINFSSFFLIVYSSRFADCRFLQIGSFFLLGLHRTYLFFRIKYPISNSCKVFFSSARCRCGSFDFIINATCLTIVYKYKFSPKQSLKRSKIFEEQTENVVQDIQNIQILNKILRTKNRKIDPKKRNNNNRVFSLS